MVWIYEQLYSKVFTHVFYSRGNKKKLLASKQQNWKLIWFFCFVDFKKFIMAAILRLYFYSTDFLSSLSTVNPSNQQPSQFTTHTSLRCIIFTSWKSLISKLFKNISDILWYFLIYWFCESTGIDYYSIKLRIRSCDYF